MHVLFSVIINNLTWIVLFVQCMYNNSVITAIFFINTPYVWKLLNITNTDYTFI